MLSDPIGTMLGNPLGSMLGNPLGTCLALQLDWYWVKAVPDVRELVGVELGSTLGDELHKALDETVIHWALSLENN